MDINKIIARAKAILLSPKTEWPVIAGESATTASLYKDYAVWLAAVAAVATFISMTLVGTSVGFLGTYRTGVMAGLGTALWTFVASLLGVFLFALLLNFLAPKFGAQQDATQALKTSVYTATAGWAGSVLGILPGVGMLLSLVAALYAIYLLYLGVQHTMKCPQDRAVGYTAVAIIVAIIAGWLLGMVAGGVMGIGRGALGGLGANTAVESEGGFDADSPGGKLEAWAKQMEKAGKDMEAAQKSGDANAQAEAAKQMMGTVFSGGQGQVEALEPARIKAFLPESLAGLPRTEVSAERNAAMGMQISEAKASYGDGNRSIRLEIQDLGGAGGLMALAGWAGIEQEKETATGYEKTYKAGGRMVHEEWDRDSGRGEYAVIVASRFSVKAAGEAGDIGALKAAVGSVDLNKLEDLRGEGVKAN